MGGGYQCWDIFQGSNGIIFLRNIFGAGGAVDATLFHPQVIEQPIAHCIAMFYNPLWGSCMQPGVLLDHVMGWWSFWATFTDLVSCRQQGGGGTVHSILKS